MSLIIVRDTPTYIDGPLWLIFKTQTCGNSGVPVQMIARAQGKYKSENVQWMNAVSLNYRYDLVATDANVKVLVLAKS